MKYREKLNIFNGACLTAVVAIYAVGCSASEATSEAVATVAVTQDGGMTGILENAAQHYPWVTAFLLLMGGLRVIFKPVMAMLDNYAKSNCSEEEYENIRNFEAGPVYRWISFGLDLVGSVKLPVVGIKPSQQNSSNQGAK